MVRASNGRWRAGQMCETKGSRTKRKIDCFFFRYQNVP